MSSSEESLGTLGDYSVLTVEKTEPPEGGESGEWHRYVIELGESTLVGSKSGSLEEVTEHAEAYAEELNQRRKNKGKTWAQSQKKNVKVKANG